MTVIRVGSTVLGIRTTHSRTAPTDKRLTALATVFAQRARQAQDGEEPTAVWASVPPAGQPHARAAVPRISTAPSSLQ
ncbi:hypothetical protein OHA79_23465 [Streptomyces sp. NBC_00841]|uniref:hypothetical protein n=1 Tax=Streptomyces sp. NBC_00841 TaxID=2975847 RepID=UPI002DD8200F|nr:hypothetical protein [Streptomyces sp. NBC_00841]WSA00547.1 hypothetical protein OHA79_23465 [Streptomyces sp. NBC_00841]